MSEKPLVAIVVNTSWNIYNFRMNIVKALHDNGYRVLCIAPEDEYSSLLVSDDVSYIPVNMDRRGVNPWNDLILCCSLVKLFKKHRPHVILQFTIKPNLYGTIAARLCGIPVINNVSGLGTVFLNKNLSSKIALVLYRVAFTFPIKVFFQNTTDQGLFMKTNLVRPSQCAVLPGSGVDLKRFSYVEKERQKPFVFLMASRLLYDKGVQEYLDACVLVKAQLGDQVQCALQGAVAEDEQSGLVKGKLEQTLKKYGIVYYSFTDRIEDYVRKADVIVLPSYREGLSRLLLESAAMGKPLIATNVPGCREIVRHGVNGLLCKVKDATALSRVMVEMYEKTSAELKSYSIQSRRIVEQEYSDEIVTTAYLNAVRSALDNRLVIKK